MLDFSQETRIRSNPLTNRATYQQMQREVAADPGGFHGKIAKQMLHWYDPKLNAWITFDPTTQSWTGLDATSGASVPVDYAPDHAPWHRAFNSDNAPFFKWFEGGLTNACFNEVDRHVLMGHGDEIAFIFEGDRWDQSKNDGRGGPVVSFEVSRKKLLLETVKAAVVLRNLGLKKGDRLALNMPNIMEQIYFTEAAKRVGIIYTPVFGGFSDKTLSDRIHNAGARVVITSDGGYRNAQIVPYKEAYTDKALDNFVPVETVLEIVKSQLAQLDQEITALTTEQQQVILNKVQASIGGEITVERADVMRSIGMALADESFRDLDIDTKSHIRTSIALGLVASPERVDAVIVVRHTRQPDLVWRTRDRWAHELLATASQEIFANASKAGINVSNEGELLALPDADFVRALYATNQCEPVDADYPLFFIYTSGSTGKPKGVVHVHGGYESGIAYTMRVAFDAQPGDVMYVVADPGWITGQSYMIAASLLTRVTSVMTEGAPVFPSAGRFSSIIERYKVNIFKAGVTFLKAVMTDPQNVADVRHYDMDTLRVATFCAEPCSPAVQQFGMELMTPQYINSYWATEHGGIVWTHFFGNPDFPLRPDAHTYALPWIGGEVWLQEDGNYRTADLEEKGEIIITQPYPYLARTIWGDPDNVSKPGWKGDGERFAKNYWRKHSDGRLGYIQGDFAMQYPDDSFSLHGRSDDVINVSGHRMGTEEIEGAILRDKQINPDSPVGNVIVVGAPHREKGLTPVAFVLPAPGRRLTVEDEKRLANLVRDEKGAVAVPGDFITVAAFPETRSGKYMRRFLKNIINDEDLGDTTTLKNPEALTEIRTKIEDWKRKQARSEDQKIFETYRYFRIQYNNVTPDAKIATVTITNPPVNALNERSLDELITVVDHLARRDDVKVVIFTGQGTKSFVAGADIKQLLEEMNTYEDAIALPHNAHLAFRKIETMNKPVIAAINGVALGGGLEFALACHYRIAEPTAQFGQPEINLNLLPGYGGTQRLPRLIHKGLGELAGTEMAACMILGGRQIDAKTAKDYGIIDSIANGNSDVLTEATRLAILVIKDPKGLGLFGDMLEKRKRDIETWEKSQTFPDIEKSPAIHRVLVQAKNVGREKAVERALEAMRHGFENGFSKGLKHEAELFAQAVIDPEGGKKGIKAFLDKKSAPLPVRDHWFTEPQEFKTMEKDGSLLSLNAPFYPGFTSIPEYQYAAGVVKDVATGAPAHADPLEAEQQIVIPVEKPGPNQALLYMLTSEINYNDIWAITGIPVSQLEGRERDWHITGSGGIALVASIGSELKREGRVKVGDMVIVYSGESEMLSPAMGNDPMFAEFHIQGYDGSDGSHQQFLLVQGPQMHPKPADLTLEAAGSYILNLGTVYRALFTTLKIEPGRTLFVEGAATGTGMETAKTAARNGLKVTGLVSSNERAESVKKLGATAAINRKDEAINNIWTRIPAEKEKWAAWEMAGAPLVEMYRAQNERKLADYAVSHAGEQTFPRSFQLLETGGTLTFFGASTGYHFTFMGKPGNASPHAMFQKAGLRAGEAVLIYYGPPSALDKSGIVDTIGLNAIEAAREMGGRCVVVTYTDAQRDFVQSLGYGDAVKGVVSIQGIKRREGDDFLWPMLDGGMPSLPDPKTDIEAFKEAVRQFNDVIFKPVGAAVGGFLKTMDNPRGYPDVVFERAGHDALSVSTALVKPYTGRIVYAEEMGGQRFSFYAPQVWMRQRRIYMPTANIWGTHLCNAYEVTLMNDMIDAGMLDITEPLVVPFDEMPAAHQAMWENRHAAGNYVCNHALPVLGLKTKEELFEAWSQK